MARPSREKIETMTPKILALYEEHMTLKDIAKECGVGMAFITAVLERYGVKEKRSMSNIPHDRHQEVIARYKAGETLTSIARSVGAKKGDAVLNLLRHYGEFVEKVPVQPGAHKNAKYYYLDDLFEGERIRTPREAYLLGFALTDGYITSGGRSLEWNVSTKDAAHLEKLRGMIKTDSPIRNYVINGHEVTRFGLYNKKLVENIARFGVVPRKTYITKFPPDDAFESPELVRFFLSGVFDGDGSFGFYFSQNQLRSVVSFVGMKDFILEVQKRLQLISGTNGHFKASSENIEKDDGRAWALSFGGNDSVPKIMHYLLHDNEFAMERKRQKFEEFQSLIEKTDKFA